MSEYPHDFRPHEAVLYTPPRTYTIPVTPKRGRITCMMLGRDNTILYSVRLDDGRRFDRISASALKRVSPLLQLAEAFDDAERV